MIMNNNSSAAIFRYFSPRIKSFFSQISESDFKLFYEIRLRTDAPVAVRNADGEKYLTTSGKFISDVHSAVICTKDDMEYSFNAVCDNSVHSYSRELKEGFITIPGGHRVGICGTAVTSGSKMKTIKNVSGMNFRLAKQIIGCADEIYDKVFNKGPCGLLIAGAPLSGKTTVLRDLCRRLANEYRIAVIDERSELAAVYLGEPQNDVGAMSDIFDGYPKMEGIQTAIRVMSPDMIICDEIGAKSDVKALIASANTGVKIVASVHAGSPQELQSRKYIMKLMKTGAFEYIAFLDNKNRTGRVKSVIKYKDFISES